jgi:hypothetical protein
MKVNIFFSKIVGVPLVIALVGAFCAALPIIKAQELIIGDVSGDGDITSVDASMALQIANGILSPTIDQRSAADADQNGSVTSTDAEMILTCAAEKCSVFTQETIGPGGGTLEAEDLTITIPRGAFAEETTITIKTIDAYPIQYETMDALGSFYQLEHFPQIQEPITIEIAFDPSVISTEDSVYIYQEQTSFITGGVGEVQSGHPRLDTEVDRINGTATIQIVPYETSSTTLRINNAAKSSGQQGSYLADGQDTLLTFGAGVLSPSPLQLEDNYFRLTDLTGRDDAELLNNILTLLNNAKDKLESLEFSLDKGKYLPMTVNITNNLNSQGYDVPAEATLPSYPFWQAYYSLISIKPGFNEDQYRVFTGHELFHIIQWLNDAYSNQTRDYQYKWLNEASSTWFETKLSPDGKNYFSAKARTNSTFVYAPLETDDEDHGYGASSFLTYLIDQSSSQEGLMLTIYQKIKNGEDKRKATGALQAALGGSEELSELFREFAFKFISKTTEYTNWPEPDPPPGGEFTIYPDAPSHISTLNPSALSAWNLKVNLPRGSIPPESYKLVVSLDGGNSFISGAVYTHDAASDIWQLACEFTPDGTCEITQFYGNGKRLSANVILVNHQAEHPYDQDVPVSLTLEIKEEVKSIVGIWDVTKYDHLCQGFWSQKGELHIFSNGTYTIDLEELKERGIADFAGTWELKQEPHITDNPRAYFYSNGELIFIGTVNDTYTEISCQGCITPANIIVCVHAEKSSDTP